MSLSCWASRLYRFQSTQLASLARLEPLLQLAARLHVAQVFWSSGLTKVQNWEGTLFLFQEEYQVPLLPPELAAWMGTGGELALPPLLALGLLGRFSALGLFVVNLVAVLSLAEVPPVALQQHIQWGGLLAWLAITGVGRWSLDGWLAARIHARTSAPELARHPST